MNQYRFFGYFGNSYFVTVPNCQDAVSISLVNHHAGLPVGYRLYLPKEWTDDPVRCRAAGVPEDVVFQKKWEIALDLVDQQSQAKVPQAPFLGDAGYGQVPAFRQGLTARGLRYVLGIQMTEMIWPPGWAPLPAGTKPQAQDGPEPWTICARTQPIPPSR